jgi:hypothetical protein
MSPLTEFEKFADAVYYKDAAPAALNSFQRLIASATVVATPMPGI